MRITRGLFLATAAAAAKSPVALTIGNFDGVHLGHRAMLDELARAAQRLNVPSCVMIFEPQPREFFAPDKAPARLTSLREKRGQANAQQTRETDLQQLAAIDADAVLMDESGWSHVIPRKRAKKAGGH